MSGPFPPRPPRPASPASSLLQDTVNDAYAHGWRKGYSIVAMADPPELDVTVAVLSGIAQPPVTSVTPPVPEPPALATGHQGPRVLVPATGVYEWQAVPGQKPKQPYDLRRWSSTPCRYSAASASSITNASA